MRYRPFQLPIWQAQTLLQLRIDGLPQPGPRATAANNEPRGGLPPVKETAVVLLANVPCEEKLGDRPNTTPAAPPQPRHH